jgi:HEAT repeat protein
MKNRLYLACGVLLVAALGWATWQAIRPPPRQPVYDSKSLSYWLTNSVSVLPPRLMSDSNAVPFLIRALKRDSWVGAAVYRKQLWPKLPTTIRRHLPPPVDDSARRRTSVAILSQMGPMAEPAVPALTRILREDDDHPFVLVGAAAALSKTGKGDNGVVRALIKVLKGTNTLVRQSSAVALGQVGQENRLAVAALVGALADKDRSVQIRAAEALCKLLPGEGTSSAVTVMTGALLDTDVRIRREATNALLHAAPKAAAEAGIPVEVLLRKERGRSNLLAIVTASERFSQYGERDRNTIAMLTNALNDEDARNRAEATNALLKIDPAAAAKAGIKSSSP